MLNRDLFILLFYLSACFIGCTRSNTEAHNSKNRNVLSDDAISIDLRGLDTVVIRDSFQPFVFKVEHDTADQAILSKLSIFVRDSTSPFQIIEDTSQEYRSASLIDINLDGYLDICFELGLSGITPNHEFWLYDTLRKQFIFSKEFANLGDYGLDRPNKQIESHWIEKGGTGASENKYNIVNGHLVLFATGSSHRDEYEDQNMINGVLTTTKKGVVKALDDDEDEPTWEVSEYEWILDSLRLKQRLIKKQIAPALADSLSKNNIIEGSPWGDMYLCIERDSCVYKQLTNGTIIRSEKQYKVFNKKWVLVFQE